MKRPPGLLPGGRCNTHRKRSVPSSQCVQRQHGLQERAHWQAALVNVEVFGMNGRGVRARGAAQVVIKAPARRPSGLPKLSAPRLGVSLVRALDARVLGKLAQSVDPMRIADHRVIAGGLLSIRSARPMAPHTPSAMERICSITLVRVSCFKVRRGACQGDPLR